MEKHSFRLGNFCTSCMSYGSCDCKNTNLIEEAMMDYWGKRCDNFKEGCPCCAAWKQLDDLK